jgi:hypothetical protein
VLLFLLIGAIQKTNASGNTKTEDRQVSGFHALDISGSYTVELTQGNQESLKIEADEDVLGNIITEVKNGALTIKMQGKHWRTGHIKIFLTFKSLDMISSAGSLALKGTGLLKFANLDLEVSGSADIDMQLEATKLRAEMSGSSDAKLQGTVADMQVEISGAGNLEAIELTCQNFDLEISGSGDAKINVAQQLNVDISGSGAVVYKGNPNIKKSISGSGSIKKLG